MISRALLTGNAHAPHRADTTAALACLALAAAVAVGACASPAAGAGDQATTLTASASGTVVLPGGPGGGWVNGGRPGYPGGTAPGSGELTPGGSGGGGSTAASTYRFVWIADSRGTEQGDPVDTPVLTAIIAAVGKLSPAPAFVMFGGDMSFRGYIGTSYTYQAWTDLFAPLTNAGIPLYTALGNHELYREHQQGFFLANQQEYQREFSTNPDNGPAGYDNLVYSFTSPDGNSFFAVLDPYYLTGDTDPSGLGGHIDAAQMSWLTAQVAATHATHKFLFIHTPYYYMNEDPSEPSAADTSYTNLWAFLDANRFDVYACGHSHLFSRKTIDASVAPEPQVSPPVTWHNGVVQLLNGAAGAGPGTGPTERDASWNVHNAPQTYYFSVFDVAGPTVTVNSYAGDTGAYSVIDSFTVTR